MWRRLLPPNAALSFLILLSISLFWADNPVSVFWFGNFIGIFLCISLCTSCATLSEWYFTTMLINFSLEESITLWGLGWVWQILWLKSTWAAYFVCYDHSCSSYLMLWVNIVFLTLHIISISFSACIGFLSHKMKSYCPENLVCTNLLMMHMVDSYLI